MSQFDITVEGGSSVRLPTAGKYCDRDIVITAEGGGGGGGGSVGVAEKDVNYYDYDGTVLYSYTTEEALALSEEPALPKHSGLTCQGWNVSFENMQDYVRKNGKRDIGAVYITDDGKTRLYINLCEGRTSPMLGLGVNGTVTVDWGDGTAPDILTGTSVSTIVRTPNHEYASAGDYVISLSVDGEIGFCTEPVRGWFYNVILSQYAPLSDSICDKVYLESIIKIELGNGVTNIDEYCFYNFTNLVSITIPEGVTSISDRAFQGDYSLAHITFPKSITAVGDYVFYSSYAIKRVSFSDSAITVGNNAFYQCYGLAKTTLSDKASYGSSCFASCGSFLFVVIPEGTTRITSSMFNADTCSSYRFPSTITKIDGKAFERNYSAGLYDFSRHTKVPTLGSYVFEAISTDCEIRVPAALVDEWKAATNWSTWADYIVGV